MDERSNKNPISEEIRKEIESLLYTKFGLSKKLFLSAGNDAFFGLRGLLVPRELTYLAYMLEQQFGIQFTMEEYNDTRFYSISGLSEIVTEMLNENSHEKVSL